MSKGSAKMDAVHRIRLGHVRRLLQHQYRRYRDGLELPDDDAGMRDLHTLLHVMAWCYHPYCRMQALLQEAKKWCPWLEDAEAREIATEIADNPMKFKADTLGRMLNLDAETRQKLRLWQIGAVDMDAAARKNFRKVRHRERMKRIRQAKGAKPRAEYEAASLTKTEPWKAEGICRRTWERRRRKVAMSQVRAQTCEEIANGAMSQVRAQSNSLQPDHTLATRHESGSGKQRETSKEHIILKQGDDRVS